MKFLKVLPFLILTVLAPKPPKYEMQSEAYYHMERNLKGKEYDPYKRPDYARQIAYDIKESMARRYRNMFCDVQVFLLDNKSPCVWSTRTSNYADYDSQTNQQYIDNNWNCVAFIFMYDKEPRGDRCEPPTFNSQAGEIQEVANEAMERQLSGLTEFNNNNASEQADAIAEDVQENLKSVMPMHSYGVSVCMTSKDTGITGVAAHYGMTPRDGITSAVYSTPGYWCCVYVDGIQNQQQSLTLITCKLN
eukprot:TRINITY_DN1535_c0_g2_i1.p1 TRINITY_DN1535_c0_g2~~TRINITY_DN1535_c0_g2_i1.p1  ORF type:complete len:248 (+),score=19.73 TRINITY_DN1535_c0_g2_i1:203-946(+)